MPRRPTTSPTQAIPCEACDTPIFFALSPAGRLMPLDAAITPDGAAAVQCDVRGVWRARILPRGEEPTVTEKRHAPHWQTCSDPDKFRRRRELDAARADRARRHAAPAQAADPPAALFDEREVTRETT